MPNRRTEPPDRATAVSPLFAPHTDGAAPPERFGV